MSFPILTRAICRLRKIRALLLGLALPLATAACLYIPIPPAPPLSPFEEAAHYDWLIGEKRYSEPLNAWVRSKPLERFLFREYSSGGLDALKARYGFECAPRAIVPPCANCQTCRAAHRMRLAEQELDILDALSGRSAPMLIEVEIGPGTESFQAMTYWERQPGSGRVGK